MATSSSTNTLAVTAPAQCHTQVITCVEPIVERPAELSCLRLMASNGGHGSHAQLQQQPRSTASKTVMHDLHGVCRLPDLRAAGLPVISNAGVIGSKKEQAATRQRVPSNTGVLLLLLKP